MDTALAILNQGQIVLSELEQEIMAEAATETAAYETVPTKISLPSGNETQFGTPDGAHLEEIECVIVVSQMARAWWPEKGTGQPPLCASFDGSIGILQGEPTNEQFAAAMQARIPHPAIPLLTEKKPVPATFPCGTCPMAQWGSAYQNGNGSRGQACKTLRRLVLAVKGWEHGALLTLPPTSVKGFDLYASALARERSAYHAVWTRITLERQQAGKNSYAVARFKKGKPLTREEYAAVRALRARYAVLVRSMPFEEAEYETVDAEAHSVNGNGYAGDDGADNENPF